MPTGLLKAAIIATSEATSFDGADFIKISQGNPALGDIRVDPIDPAFDRGKAWQRDISGNPSAFELLVEAIEDTFQPVDAASAWVNPALLNGWVNQAGAGRHAFRYRKQFGCVLGSGVLDAASASATTFFVLPSGFRPAYDMYLPFAIFGGGTVPLNSALFVLASGSVGIVNHLLASDLAISFSLPIA